MLLDNLHRLQQDEVLKWQQQQQLWQGSSQWQWISHSVNALNCTRRLNSFKILYTQKLIKVSSCWILPQQLLLVYLWSHSHCNLLMTYLCWLILTYHLNFYMFVNLFVSYTCVCSWILTKSSYLTLNRSQGDKHRAAVKATLMRNMTDANFFTPANTQTRGWCSKLNG